MVTKRETFIKQVAGGISKDKPAIDELRRQRIEPFSQWLNRQQPPTEPPEQEQPIEPFSAWLGRQQPTSARVTAPYRPPDISGQIVPPPLPRQVERVVYPGASERATAPGTFQGYEEPRSAYAELNEMILQTARKPVFTVAGVSVSASELAGALVMGAELAVAGPELVGVAKKVGDKAFEKLLNTGLDKWLATQSRILPEARTKLGDLLVGNRPWFAERVTQNYQRRMAEAKLARTGNVAARTQAVEDTLQELEAKVLPSFTPGGTAVPGQTKSLAEMQVGARAELKPRTITLYRGEPVGVRPIEAGPVPFTPDLAVAQGWAGRQGRVVQVTIPEQVFNSLPFQKLPDQIATYRLPQELYGTAIPMTEVIPRAAPGMPEAGLQPSMIPEVAAREVTPAGKGRITQISMDEQLKYDQAMQVAQASQDALANDVVANYKFEVPVSAAKPKVTPSGELVSRSKAHTRWAGLDSLVSPTEQSFPEYFTVKQAQLLNPNKSFADYNRKGLPTYNKVPRDVALDDLTKKFNMSADEIADRVMANKAMRQQAQAPLPEGVAPPPPTVPPVVPPTAAIPPVGAVPPIPPSIIGEVSPTQGPEPRFSRLVKIIEQSDTVVKRDRQGNFTKILSRIPGVERLLKYERPGLKMTGENEKVLVGYVGESAARNDIATQSLATRGSVVDALKTNFGVRLGLRAKSVIQGGKSKVKFIGTPEQAKNPITGTLKDIADNPELYQLTPVQKEALVKLNERNNQLLSLVTQGYGAEIGQFAAKEGGAFLPNVDISQDIVQSVSDEMRAVASGRQKTRYYPSARERMAHDKSFKPELNVEKLIDGMDRAKASAAGGQTFRMALGGKNRLEVMQETHPVLAKKMEALQKRLSSLRGSAGRLDEKLDKALTDFMASPTEGADLSALQSSLDVKLATGPRKGMNLKDIQKELDGVRAQIKALKPAWEIANLKPYQFVQQGIYRYFPHDQAGLIRDLLKRSDNPFLNFIEKVRGTAFSGDFSPILGVQTPVGILADPIGAFTQAGGGLAKMIREKDPLISFTIEGLAKDINKDVEGWSQFFSLIGRAPSGTPQEFAGGFLAKIPGFAKFNESTFLLVTRQTKNLYDKNWKSLVKGGLSELDAKVAAASTATQIFPMLNPSRLGQSQARQALLGSLPTSYSFIRKPAELMVNAAKGFGKTATGQTITAEELISMKLLLTMAASVLVTSAVSQAIDAERKGNDPLKAALDAINPDPDNGKFLSIMVGNIRVPIGGPYRALFRAMYPSKVSVAGKDVSIPFWGLRNYLKNRITPFIRTQIDLIKNEDYYKQKIRKGDIAEQILRTLAYEFEGAVPLTVGTAVGAARTGMPQEEMLTQVAGQFAGVNVIENPQYGVKTLKDRYAKQDYGMPFEGLNQAQMDDLMRNHPDLKAADDEARRGRLLKGADLPKVYAALTEQAVAVRNAGLSKAAQSLLDGEITKDQYDSERGYIRPYYSGQRNALWQFREQLDPEQAKQLANYFNESSKPADKALDAYWTYYSQVVDQADLPKDWDVINQQLETFVGKYPANIQRYILSNKDAWIKDLPQPARQIEEQRAAGIEDGTWWDGYRGKPTTGTSAPLPPVKHYPTRTPVRKR